MTLDSDKVEKDVIKLIEKHYPKFLIHDINLFGEVETLGDKGFYLFFIKRDETKTGRLSVYTFGGNIKIDDVIEAFAAKLHDTLNRSNEKIPVA